MADTPRTPALIGVIAVFVLLGFPLVYIIWEAVNHALAFDLAGIRWVLVVPALALFVALLFVLSRVVRKLARAAGTS